MDTISWGTDANLIEDQFYDRKNEIALLKSILKTTEDQLPSTTRITGVRGVGKTVLLKKIQKELEEDYLIAYIDLSRIPAYQKGNLAEEEIIKNFYNAWIKSCQESNLTSILEKINKILKTKNFKIKEIVNVNKIPIPLIETKDNYNKLVDFVLDLPQSIYEKNSDKIKGCIFIIDEFHALIDLGSRLDSFLWMFRSFIQEQKNVSYVFSGSLNSINTVVEKIAGNDGVFGGRILNIKLEPFSKDIVQSYLNEKVSQLKITDMGFERFYECTRGVPFYINIFARFLPKNVLLDEEDIKKEFKQILPFLALHFIQLWAGLNKTQQEILVSLIDKPLKRKDIASKLNKQSGSLSLPLNELVTYDLIRSQNGLYIFSESILKNWLKNEFEEKGVFPFRSI